MDARTTKKWQKSILLSIELSHLLFTSLCQNKIGKIFFLLCLVKEALKEIDK